MQFSSSSYFRVCQEDTHHCTSLVIVYQRSSFIRASQWYVFQININTLRLLVLLSRIGFLSSLRFPASPCSPAVSTSLPFPPPRTRNIERTPTSCSVHRCNSHNSRTKQRSRDMIRTPTKAVPVTPYPCFTGLRPDLLRSLSTSALLTYFYCLDRFSFLHLK
jgi:hypothetical protein